MTCCVCLVAGGVCYYQYYHPPLCGLVEPGA